MRVMMALEELQRSSAQVERYVDTSQICGKRLESLHVIRGWTGTKFRLEI